MAGPDLRAGRLVAGSSEDFRLVPGLRLEQEALRAVL
jgi:hypothetical protein